MSEPEDLGSAEPTGPRRSGYAWMVLVVLLMPLATGLFTGAADLETNSGRNLPRPELGFGYPGELSGWLGERAATKNLAVRVDGWIDRHIFGELPSAGAESPRVTYGSSGVMFIADAFNEACRPHILTTQLVGQIERLSEVVRDSGREFKLVVSPDKSTILSEYLPTDFSLRECFKEYNTDFWDQLRSSEIDGFIDLRASLESARLARRELLFKRRDTHWDDAGAAVASAAVVNSITPSLWDDDVLMFNGLTEYFGDLNVLSGESEVDTAPAYTAVRPEVSQVSVVVIDDLEHGRNRRISNEGPNTSLIPGRTLIFGDSFSEAAEPFFTAYFEDLTLMRLVDFSTPRFIELITSADRVIFWSVERTFPYRVAFDWGTDEFINELERSLR